MTLAYLHNSDCYRKLFYPLYIRLCLSFRINIGHFNIVLEKLPCDTKEVKRNHEPTDTFIEMLFETF